MSLRGPHSASAPREDQKNRQEHRKPNDDAKQAEEKATLCLTRSLGRMPRGHPGRAYPNEESAEHREGADQRPRICVRNKSHDDREVDSDFRNLLIPGLKITFPSTTTSSSSR